MDLLNIRNREQMNKFCAGYDYLLSQNFTDISIY